MPPCGRVLERGDERADVEREPVGREPEAVLLQRDQLRAVHQVPEGAVQDAVAECLTEIADDDRLHVGFALPQFGEVLLDGVIHHERNSAMAAVGAAAHGECRGRDQLARLRVESEPLQAVQDRAAGTGGRVGDEAQCRTGGAKRRHGLERARDRRVLHVEDAVEVDQQRMEVIGHRLSGRPRTGAALWPRRCVRRRRGQPPPIMTCTVLLLPPPEARRSTPPTRRTRRVSMIDAR